MKTIEVRDQVSLPLKRCFQLCVRGIRYRLFRSAITVVIVSLAVAFLMMMLSASTIEREVAGDVQHRTAGRRLLEDWTDKLTVSMTEAVLMERLARLSEGSPGWTELANWAGPGQGRPEQLQRLAAMARLDRRYQRYFAGLKPGEYTSLVGTRQGEDIYAYLSQPGALEGFFASAGKLPTPFPTDRETLETFLGEYRDTAGVRQAILAGHARAVQGLRQDLQEQSMLGALASPDESTMQMLRNHGFALPAEELRAMSGEAVLAADAQRLAFLLRDKRMRGVVANRVGSSVSDVNEVHLFSVGSSLKGAQWLKDEVQTTRRRNFEEQVQAAAVKATAAIRVGRQDEQLTWKRTGPGEVPDQAITDWVGRQNQEGDFSLVLWVNGEVATAGTSAPPAAVDEARKMVEQRWAGGQVGKDVLAELDLSPERIVGVCRAQLQQVRLSAVETRLSGQAGELWLGFSGRTVWLILISFLVCVVGVTNAMLMSVTERFREIATMKCLGALDSFIMIIFVLESALQGLAGGCVGVVIGLLLGLLRSVWGLGVLALVNLPPLAILASAAVCVVSGVVLASLAAVYPAWVAARLAPMEAMRIE